VPARVFDGARDLIIPVAGGELKFAVEPGAGPDGNHSGCNFIKGGYIDDPIGIAKRGSRCRR
jgi:hypothetical protein